MLTQIYVQGNHSQCKDRVNLTNGMIMEQSCISDPGRGLRVKSMELMVLAWHLGNTRTPAVTISILSSPVSYITSGHISLVSSAPMLWFQISSQSSTE